MPKPRTDTFPGRADRGGGTAAAGLAGGGFEPARQRGCRQGGGGGPPAGVDGDAGEMDCGAFAHGHAVLCELIVIPAAKGNMTISRTDPFTCQLGCLLPRLDHKKFAN